MNSALSRRLAVILMVTLCMISLVAFPKPAVAYQGGSITYFRYDRYRQSNGLYTVKATYCLVGKWHDLAWGELRPKPWQTDPVPRFGEQNGCVTRTLFYDVLVNDLLFTNLYVNQVTGDVDAEARFQLERTSDYGWRCSLLSDYLNGMRAVRGNPCAWTTDSRLW